MVMEKNFTERVVEAWLYFYIFLYYKNIKTILKKRIVEAWN